MLAAGLSLLGALALGTGSGARSSAPRRGIDHPREAEVAATGVRRLEQGAAVLAASVLVDSAMEHFRGNFENRLMYVPPAVAAASVTTALREDMPRRVRNSVFGAGAAFGISGLGLHLYNIMKRPGGFSWNNLFYAAPIAAPGALTLSGVLGLAAGFLEHRHTRRGARRTRRELGKGLALLLSGGIMATVAEVWLLHFRGAYHNPVMYAPVTLPPLAAASLAVTAVNPTRERIWFTRLLLRMTAVLGLIGSGFHAYGVQRNMGGWRNWTQNLFQGPPLPAPPSFTGVAIAALGVLGLLKPRQ